MLATGTPCLNSVMHHPLSLSSVWLPGRFNMFLNAQTRNALVNIYFLWTVLPRSGHGGVAGRQGERTTNSDSL